MGLVSQANVLARIGALGGIYGIELAPMHQALGTLGPRLSRGTVVTVPITFDRLAITTRVGREQLDGIVETDQLARIDRLTAGTRDLELGLEAGGARLARTVRVDDGRDLEADLRRLAAWGLAPAALEPLRTAAAELGVPAAFADRAAGDALAWELQFRHRNATDEQRAATRSRLVAVARELAATAAQCKLVDGIHDMLAKDRDSFSALVVSETDARPQLVVRWQHVRWESAIRIALGFQPGSDVGKKLGELAGAFDAEHAHTVELALGPAEPPAMRVAVAFVA